MRTYALTGSDSGGSEVSGGFTVKSDQANTDMRCPYKLARQVRGYDVPVVQTLYDVAGNGGIHAFPIKLYLHLHDSNCLAVICKD